MNPIHTIETYQLHMQINQKSEQTQRSYLTAVRRFIEYQQCKVNGPINIQDIKEEDIETYLYYLQKEKSYKPASVNLQLNAIRNYFKFACKKGWCDTNPALHIDSVKNNAKRRDFLTSDELNALIDVVNHPLGKLVIRTLAYTGMRVGECLALTLDDVNFSENKIFVRNGKGNKPRVIPLSPILKPYLEAYLNGPRSFVKGDRFFATPKTGSFSAVYINRLIQEAVEKLKWSKHVTAHTLRHSFASMLVKKGVALPTVAALLGHADFRTVTSVYVHIEDSALAEAVSEICL